MVFPYIMYSLNNTPWGTKCVTGYETVTTIDIWSDHHGDKELKQIIDIINPLFDNKELDLTAGQNVMLIYDGDVTFPEDGQVRHTVITFRALSA